PHALIVQPGPNADPASPCLAGWGWPERKTWPETWNRFVDELWGSADSAAALEGLFLRCSWSWSSEDFAQNLERLFDFIWAQRQSIVASGLFEGLEADVKAL